MPPRRPRGRRVLAAKMVAGGKPAAEVAAELGVSRRAVDKAVTAVLSYERFEDVRNCRLLANRRLDTMRSQLLAAAGWADPESMVKPSKPKTPPSLSELTGLARALTALEERRAKMFGYDAPQHVIQSNPDPLESMTPEELLASCQSLNIPVPPGLADEVARRARRSDQAAEITARGAPAAG